MGCLWKSCSCHWNSRIWRDMTYSKIISFHFLNFLSHSTIPVASKRGIKDISQKKEDWLWICISFVVFKQYVSFKRSLFLLELLELHKLLSCKGDNKCFWSWKVVICVKINKTQKLHFERPRLQPLLDICCKQFGQVQKCFNSLTEEVMPCDAEGALLEE